jgi:fluoroacetyl-CoA thioesterase
VPAAFHGRLPGGLAEIDRFCPQALNRIWFLFTSLFSGGLTLNPTEKIRPGMMGSETTVVTREITVAHFHPEMPEVYGTPFMIYLMEVAASKAIQPCLPAGWVSVGTEVNVKHLAATPLGRTVTATARVASLADRLITFSVESHDGAEQIGVGTHVRAVIDLSRFERHLQAKRPAET